MDQAGIVTLIDEALERFAVRDLISSAEVVDFLLDLRTAVVSDAALAALIDSEAQPDRTERDGFHGERCRTRGSSVSVTRRRRVDPRTCSERMGGAASIGLAAFDGGCATSRSTAGSRSQRRDRSRTHVGQDDARHRRRSAPNDRTGACAQVSTAATPSTASRSPMSISLTGDDPVTEVSIFGLRRDRRAPSGRRLRRRRHHTTASVRSSGGRAAARRGRTRPSNAPTQRGRQALAQRVLDAVEAQGAGMRSRPTTSTRDSSAAAGPVGPRQPRDATPVLGSPRRRRSRYVPRAAHDLAADPRRVGRALPRRVPTHRGEGARPSSPSPLEAAFSGKPARASSASSSTTRPSLEHRRRRPSSSAFTQQAAQALERIVLHDSEQDAASGSSSSRHSAPASTKNIEAHRPRRRRSSTVVVPRFAVIAASTSSRTSDHASPQERAERVDDAGAVAPRAHTARRSLPRARCSGR